ncbi:MAG: major capsid protein [Pelagibaca sp.]
MSVLNVFNQDAFSVMRLTDALREIKYVPSRIGQLGLFATTSIDTLDIAIEKDREQNQIIIGSTPRGGPGQTFGKNGRSMRTLRVPHFQVDDAIMADEVQQVRAFGSEVSVERLQQKIANRAAEASQFFALTEEFHRLNIIKSGKLLDADDQVMFDYFNEFGETAPAEIDFDLDNANPAEGALRKKCVGVVRQTAAILDGLPYTGIHAFCGDNFFDDLVSHPEVRETYKGFADASTLRSAYASANGQQNTFGVFEFGGITFENYRGGGSIGIDTNKCHLFPLGVPGLFRTVYAPADYIETVNTQGQRLYGKQYEMQNGKGVNLEFQMNALQYCTRPRVLIPGKRT